MPYSFPEGFFEEMEKNVREEIGKQPEIGLDAGKHSPTALRWVAAACAAILAAVGIGLIKYQNAYDDEEHAFQQLSEEDQDFLLAVYQDDIFINQ